MSSSLFHLIYTSSIFCIKVCHYYLYHPIKSKANRNTGKLLYTQQRDTEPSLCTLYVRIYANSSGWARSLPYTDRISCSPVQVTESPV